MFVGTPETKINILNVMRDFKNIEVSDYLL